MSRFAALLPRIGLLTVVALIAALGVVTLRPAVPLPTAAPSVQAGDVKVEFLGWSFYRLTSPNGKIVLLNPWVEGNPDTATTLADVIATGADIILVADAHRDEQGQAIEIAQATGASIVTPAFEMGTWLAEKGVPRPQLSFTSPGDTFRKDNITVRVLGAIHGSNPPSPSDTVYYPGVAATFMVTFENGYTVYFSGSSAATLDMGMWADMYKPDAGIIHQSAAHDPLDSAMVVKLMTNNNPNFKTVFPHHFRLQPQPGGLFRPSDLRAQIERYGVNVNFIDPNPLQPYMLRK